MTVGSNNNSGTPTEQKVASLLAQIKLAVEKGAFDEAEELRDQMIETDPMAITEAVSSAELIENTMSAAIDTEHLNIWPELYNTLSTGERNTLFHSMKQYDLPEKRMLLQYGSLNNKLFFIEDGKVTACLPTDNKKLKVLAHLGKGDVLGEYTFATMALCSATAITTSQVKIRCLDGDLAEAWEKKHPGLYNKVITFCENHGKIDQITRRKEQQTPEHPRLPVEGTVKATLLDENLKNTSVHFNGELSDISRSGTSFSIHCKKRETVKSLLTKSFSIAFSCTPNDGKTVEFSATGRVVKVSFLLYNDYLLHINLHSLIPENVMNRITQNA